MENVLAIKLYARCST